MPKTRRNIVKHEQKIQNVKSIKPKLQKVSSNSKKITKEPNPKVVSKKIKPEKLKKNKAEQTNSAKEPVIEQKKINQTLLEDSKMIDIIKITKASNIQSQIQSCSTNGIHFDTNQSIGKGQKEKSSGKANKSKKQKPITQPVTQPQAYTDSAQTTPPKFSSIYEPNQIVPPHTKPSYTNAKLHMTELIQLPPCEEAYSEIARISSDLKQCEAYIKQRGECLQQIQNVFAVQETEIVRKQEQDCLSEIVQLKNKLVNLKEKLRGLPFEFYERDEANELDRIQWKVECFEALSEPRHMKFQVWSEYAKAGEKFGNSKEGKSDPHTEIVLSKLNTEIVLYQKIHDALEELKQASKMAKMMTSEERKTLRTQAEMDLLKEGIEACNVVIDPYLLSFFTQQLSIAEGLSKEYSYYMGTSHKHVIAKFERLLNQVIGHSYQIPDLEQQINAVLQGARDIDTKAKVVKKKQAKVALLKSYDRQQVSLESAEALRGEPPVRNNAPTYIQKQIETTNKDNEKQVIFDANLKTATERDHFNCNARIEEEYEEAEDIELRNENEFSQNEHFNVIEEDVDSDDYLEEYIDEVKRSATKQEQQHEQLTETNQQMNRRKCIIQKVIAHFETNPVLKGVPALEVVDLVLNFVGEAERKYGKGTKESLKDIRMLVALFKKLFRYHYISQKLEQSKFSLDMIRQFLGKNDTYLSQIERKLVLQLQSQNQENSFLSQDKENVLQYNNNQLVTLPRGGFNDKLALPQLELYRSKGQDNNNLFVSQQNEPYQVYRFFDGNISFGENCQPRVGLYSYTRKGIYRRFPAFNAAQLQASEEIMLDDFINYVFEIVEPVEPLQAHGGSNGNEFITSGWVESEYKPHQNVIDVISRQHLENHKVTLINNGPDSQLYLLNARQISNETKKLLHVQVKKRSSNPKQSDMLFVLVTTKRGFGPGDYRLNGVAQPDFEAVSNNFSLKQQRNQFFGVSQTSQDEEQYNEQYQRGMPKKVYQKYATGGQIRFADQGIQQNQNARSFFMNSSSRPLKQQHKSPFNNKQLQSLTNAINTVNQITQKFQSQGYQGYSGARI